MKVSKVVVAVVALHVLVIGGIIVFEGCSRTHTPANPPVASDESAPGQTTDVASATQTVPAEPTPAMIPATPTSAETVAATPAVTPAARTYVVKKGDSLWKIARAESVSVSALMKANNLTKDSKIVVGKKLQVPQKAESAVAKAAPATAGEATATAATTAGGATYSVKSGDSLWKIAHANNTTVTALKQANSLPSDALKVGQKLTIPSAATPAAAKTDMAKSAAKPAPAATAAAASNVPVTYAYAHEPGMFVENKQTVHYVDAGESLTIIAQKYGVKSDELIRANNLTRTTSLQYGQRLVIPLGSATPAASASGGSALGAISSGPALAAPVVSTGTGN